MNAWSRRNTELGLVLLGGLITAALYTLASLGRTATIPGNLVGFLVVVLGLFGACHVAVRRFAPNADGVLLPIAGLLNGIGYVVIARLDHKLAGLQLTWTFIAVAAFIATLVLLRRVRDLERYRYTFMVGGIALLVLPLAPGIGRNINGSRIWVGLGPINFQPGEFAKLALAIFFASYLVEKREVLGIAARRVGPLALPELRHFGPVLLAWGVSLIVMVMEKDLGSSLLFFAFFIAVLWVATERASYLVVGGVLFLVGAAMATMAFGHVQDRVSVWLHPFADASGKGYQIVQATFSLAWGGVSGTGLGLGNPTQIPAVKTDFIFAAIGEELGLLGTTAIVAAFLLVVGVGLRIAMRAGSPFETLLATGLTSIIGFQAFIIMGGVIRLVPLTGITLPFVSYGGSSLVCNYILLALLLRISSGDNAPVPPGADDPTTFGTVA